MQNSIYITGIPDGWSFSKALPYAREQKTLMGILKKAWSLPLESFHMFVETHKLRHHSQACVISSPASYIFVVVIVVVVTYGTVISKHALALLWNAYFISLILCGSQIENTF